jgi:hypothetical protein
MPVSFQINPQQSDFPRLVVMGGIAKLFAGVFANTSRMRQENAFFYGLKIEHSPFIRKLINQPADIGKTREL